MPYLAFLARNARLLAFGFFLTFSSSLGQTYLIALFSGELRHAFDLSHGSFGGIYAVATLASGLCLIGLGRLLDRIELRLYTLVVTLAFAGAAFAMAQVGSLAGLALVLFLLRLCGQGLMTHVAITTMARYLDRGRGKGIGIAALGLPASEALLPATTVTLTALLGWRATWRAYALILLLVLPVLVLWLLQGQSERHRRLLEAEDSRPPGGGRSWSRSEVLQDARFYLMIPAVLAFAFVATGIFFHQVHMVEAKGWSLAWFASCFVAYAGATVATSLIAGPLVDRLGAVRLAPLILLPLGIGLAALVLLDHPLVALVLMLGAGSTAGMNVTVVNALWAELYGPLHLGAIRALVTSLLVMASALSPVALGWLYDRGASVEAVMLACLIYALAASILLAMALRPGR